jgi:hypothetical protein
MLHYQNNTKCQPLVLGMLHFQNNIEYQPVILGMLMRVWMRNTEKTPRDR